MTEHQAKIELTERTHHFLEIAKSNYEGRLVLPRIEIKFDLRGTSAGQAFTTSGKIRYNLTALQVEGGYKHLFEQTVPHEVAHMVQYNCGFPDKKRGNSSHGKYWQHIMRQFGVRPERCHDLPLPVARVRKPSKTYQVSCSCQVHQVSKIRLNRMLAGQKYKCIRCNSPIVF